MKFGNKKINNIFHSAEELLSILTIGQESPIFPFEVVSGFVTETRTSARRDYTATDKSEETYRVFTGEETPLIRWEGSTRAYLANPDDKELKSEYKVGKVLYGNILSQDFAQSFETDGLGKDLKDWITGEAYIIKSQTWEIQQNDLFKLYIITEKGNNKLLKIDTATNHYNEESGEWVFCEISLLALNLELEQTGIAVQQKIQFSAPGEAYAFPDTSQIKEFEGKREYVISLDQAKLVNTPITSVQVSLWGTAPLSSVTVFGRPIYDINIKDDNETYEGKIEQPRHLLNAKFLSPIDDALQTTGSIVNNFVLFLDAQLELKTYWTEWKEQQEAKYDDQKKKTYEGVLSVTDAETVASNPVNGGIDKFTHNVWDQYTVNIKNKALNTALSGYFATGSIVLDGDYEVKDIMNFASFINAQVEKLPMEITESIPFRVIGLPIIGGFLNKFISGFGLGWSSQSSWYNAGTFTALFPAGQYDFITKAVYGLKDSKGLIPVDIFNSDDDTEASAIVGSNAVRTAIRYELTDRYTNGTDEVKNTKDIGQTINGQKITIDKDMVSQERAVSGYIPDMIVVDTPAKMNYEVIYYTGEQEVFRAVYQTKGKYFNNTREWKSINFHSHWFEETGQVVSGIDTVYAKLPPGALPGTLSHRIFSPFGTGIVNVSSSVPGNKKDFVINYSKFGITKEQLLKDFSLIFKGNTGISATVTIIGVRDNVVKQVGTGANFSQRFDNLNEDKTEITKAFTSLKTAQYVSTAVKNIANIIVRVYYTITDDDIIIELNAQANGLTISNGVVNLTLSEVDLQYNGDSADEPFYGTGETKIFHPNGDVTTVNLDKLK